jgi:predicted acylesterase/phospholipase RssA
MATSERSFQIAGLRELRGAAAAEAVWTTVNNDTFFELTVYVHSFTGINLRGYRSRDEHPRALDACARTLDALEHVVAWMNRSKLVQVGNERMDRGWSDVKVTEEVWDATFANYPNRNDPHLRLLAVVKRQFVSWVTGLGEPESGPSKLIEYVEAPISRDVDLAFSGGGMRAAAFALGSALYVFESVSHRRIRQISSVSGGSITNGFLANVMTSKGGLDTAAVEELARRLVSHGLPLERAGRQFAWLLAGTLGLLTASLLLLLLAALGSPGLLIWVAVMFAGFLGLGYLCYRAFLGLTGELVGKWVASIVSDATAAPFEWTFADFFALALPRFSRQRAEDLKRRKLCDIKSEITHTFSATDLRHGEHVHFSQDWMTSSTYDKRTAPGEVRIDEAVRASAAFPGALPPVRIDFRRLRLAQDKTVGQRHLELVDGGVRDNLGHVFQTKLSNTSAAQHNTLTDYGSTKLTIVADASAPRGIADLSENVLRRILLLRRIEQLVSFPRVLTIINQSNSEGRSTALADHFSRYHSGFVVRIQDSPVEFCREIIGNEEVTLSLLRRGPGSAGTSDSLADRAEAMLRALVRNDRAAESHWQSICNVNSQIETTLNGLAADLVAQLIRHGYVLTMCHAHVKFDWPLMGDEAWSADRFEALTFESRRNRLVQNLEFCTKPDSGLEHFTPVRNGLTGAGAVATDRASGRSRR